MCASRSSDSSAHRPTAIVVSVVLAAYFGLLIVPNFWPGIGSSPYLLIWAVSLPLVLLALVVCAIWSSWALLRARRAGRATSSRASTLLLISLAGLVMFGGSALISDSIRGELPTGSHLLPFDSVAWKAPGAERFVSGDVTSRQKMLGSLIERLEPGLTRSDLEELLGPSLETSYFSASGRDLIYILGPERDRFIAIDSEWLLIWLDDSGRFERYELARD